MQEVESPFFTRRTITRNSLLSGAMALFSGPPVMAMSEATLQSAWDVRQFGAKGDGKTDDTVALQRALDRAGVVFIPPGEYMTRELHLRPATAIVGAPGWSYGGPGGSVLRLADPVSTCLLNVTSARGATIDGLALDGRDLGQGIHGMFMNRSAFLDHEDALRIER